MDDFTEEHAKRLLSKEWLAKSDSSKATPYLFKYDHSPETLSCFILITDTKSVWTEVMNCKQLARRWRICNSLAPEPFSKAAAEDAWREQMLELLSTAHTIGGIDELGFEIVESQHSDLAFELECEAFKWRWEACFVGHKRSSEIISKHLVFPLISLSHLTFSSTDVAIDKIGRTARRTVDTHIKNAISKPRVATSIRRMTAMFNFVPDLPRVVSTVEKPDLQVGQLHPEDTNPKKGTQETVAQKHDISSIPASEWTPNKRERPAEAAAVQSDSATEESETDEVKEISKPSSLPDAVGLSKTAMDSSPQQSRQPSKQMTVSTSDSESSPPRPAKKAKSKAPSSDENSEEERARRVAQLKAGNAAGGGIKRGGTRQPIKRGGKRF